MKQGSNTVKGPTIIKVDKNLDKYLKKDLFKEKIEKKRPTTFLKP